MPIPESILNQMKCCLFNDGHIAIEPIAINCGGIACKQCINDLKEKLVLCYSCKGKHEKHDMLKMRINKLAENTMHYFLNDLFEYVEAIYQRPSSSIKGKN